MNRAEQAFVAGQLEMARADLLSVQRAAGEHPAVLHLIALIEKKSGNGEAARRAFARAATLAPRDPQLANNFANLLCDLGEADEAMRRYDAAIDIDPGFLDARYNRALLLQKLGRLAEALADLEAVEKAGRLDAKIASAKGAILRGLGRIEEAAAAFDAALQRQPGRLIALHGRARLAMERGESGAPSLYRQALALHPDDRELLLGLAEALEADGDPAGIELLEDMLARQQDWLIGHETLARMRSERGEATSFADHYLAALAHRPNDRALHYSHWKILARGGRDADALAALQRARDVLSEDRQMLMMEAIFTSESGQPEHALALLDRISDNGKSPEYLFARGRMALRAGRPDEAADLLEALTREQPLSINGWAHLDLAWRLLGDERHEWLSEQPGLFGTADLDLSPNEIASLAELLRTIHKARAHPIGQSLRGGTQTRGRLFWRPEREIARLKESLEAAIGRYFADLPTADESHPLLRHRKRPVMIAGSWSVRLTGEGYHVNHVHPQGVVSSACYVALPSSIGEEDTRAGWLELGRPPKELGLSLESLSAIKPKVGRLALFPSYLFHGTRPFPAGERLTVAFDVGAL